MAGEPHRYIDTDVLIRHLTGDDQCKQARAADLFQAVAWGELVLAAPDTVIVDAVFVLSSPRLYHLSRARVSALLTPLVRLPAFGFGIVGPSYVHSSSSNKPSLTLATS